MMLGKEACVEEEIGLSGELGQEIGLEERLKSGG